MRKLLLLWLIASYQLALSQNITAVEYFVDTDPGYNSGTAVTITPAAQISNFSFPVSITALSNGIHTVFVRAKDVNGNWSITSARPFYKAALTAALPNVNKLEYFIDADPGYGSGVDVPITAGVSLSNQVFSIPLSSTANGFHSLTVRARDANGNWSITNSQPFYKAVVPAAASNINKLEYFIDADPGYGSGVDVPITAGVSINNQFFTIPLSSTSNGFHSLTVRARDANGNWSITNLQPFYKAVVPATASNINKLEYFIDDDKGYGSGVDVPITAGTTISNKSVTISVSSLTEASHVLTFRARDANGNWSVVSVQTFNVCNQPSPVASAATSITSTGFTANWTVVSGSISYELDVSTDNFSTFVTGYNSKSVPAPSSGTAVTASVTGLSQATSYQYRVRAVSNCSSVSSATISVTTPATPPSAKPTNLLFSSVTATTLTAFYTAASPAPTGYLVVRKAGSATTFVPSADISYTKGQTVGDGVVAYVGAATLFNETGLTANTQYYYTVFDYNQVGGFISYLTTAPLSNSVLTPALEPPAAPTNIQFTSLTSSGFTVAFTAPATAPTGYLVLRKSGSAPTSVPADGTTYTTLVGTDAVAYQGSATTFNETGLTQNTTYYYVVYAFNGSGTSINYLTSSTLQGSQLTPIAAPATQPTNLIFSNVTPTALTVSYTASTSPVAGYLVIRKAGTASTFIPQLNTAYTVGQVLSSGTVAYVGTALTFNETGLTASTVYFYTVFAYNQSGLLYGYQVVSPLTGSKSTFTAEPTAQPSGLVFSAITTSTLKLSFTAASPVPTGYLVVRKPGSTAPASTPADGTPYVIGDVSGDFTVAYSGNATTFNDAGLAPGTNYVYEIFSYNGSAAATNYLTTVAASNSGSVITVPPKPVAIAGGGVQQNQFTANWNATNGAVSYKLDVSKDNFVTLLANYSDLAVTGTSKDVNGLDAGTAYQYRVRAINTSGTSVSSDPITQYTLSEVPAFINSGVVTQNSFYAKWNTVFGATNYFIDVASDGSFANNTILANYNNLSVPASPDSVLVAGLTDGGTYYCRIRSSNSGGTSSSSAAKSQLLVPQTPTAQSVGANVTTSTFKASWLAANGATEYRLDVTLASNDFNPSLLTDQSINTSPLTEYIVTHLSPSTTYKFRVRAKNASGTSPSSVPILVSTQDLASQTITHEFDLPTGGSLTDYQIISIPQLTGKEITTTLTTATYQKNWRLMNWDVNQKANVDIQDVKAMQVGNGYWFNSNFSQKPSIKVTGTNPLSTATLTLHPGWNQIGNPFTTSISWRDVLNLNSSVPGIENIDSLYVYNVPTVLAHDFKISDGLRAYGGGFVNNKNTSGSLTLTIPTTVKHYTGARTTSAAIDADISKNEWFLPLKLQVGERVNEMSGIGMRSDASVSIDRYDAIALPHFFTYVDLSTNHPEFFQPTFMRDVVPTSAKFDWTFSATSNSEDRQALLSWDNNSLGNNSAQLILYDVTSGIMLNMKKVNSYPFELSTGHTIKFFFSSDGTLSPDITGLGKPYPNPFSTQVTIPFVTSEVNEKISFTLYDMMGKPVRSLVDKPVEPGYYEVIWDGTDDAGNKVSAGIYLYHFSSSASPAKSGKIVFKY